MWDSVAQVAECRVANELRCREFVFEVFEEAKLGLGVPRGEEPRCHLRLAFPGVVCA